MMARKKIHFFIAVVVFITCLFGTGCVTAQNVEDAKASEAQTQAREEKLESEQPKLIIDFRELYAGVDSEALIKFTYENMKTEAVTPKIVTEAVLQHLRTRLNQVVYEKWAIEFITLACKVEELRLVFDLFYPNIDLPLNASFLPYYVHVGFGNPISAVRFEMSLVLKQMDDLEDRTFYMLDAIDIKIQPRNFDLIVSVIEEARTGFIMEHSDPYQDVLLVEFIEDKLIDFLLEDFEANRNPFIGLLVEQLRHQDPMEPMSNSDFFRY